LKKKETEYGETVAEIRKLEAGLDEDEKEIGKSEG